jgi:hypothetical protein
MITVAKATVNPRFASFYIRKSKVRQVALRSDHQICWLGLVAGRWRGGQRQPREVVAEPRAMRTVARGVPDGGLVTTVKDENKEKVTRSQPELEDDQSLMTGAGTHAPPIL